MFNTIITPNDNDEYALYEIYLKHTHTEHRIKIYMEKKTKEAEENVCEFKNSCMSTRMRPRNYQIRFPCARKA